MSKTLMAVIFPIAIVAFLWQPFLPPRNDAVQLSRAFSVSNAKLHEVNVQAWARINRQRLTPDELASISRQIAVAMGQDQGLTSSTRTDNYLRTVDLDGSPEPGTYMHIGVQNLYPQPDGEDEAETYLMVTWSERGSAAHLEMQMQKLKNAFEIFNASPKITVGFSGTVPGHLTSKDAQKMIAQIFGAVGGKVKEGITEGGLISVSGFSRRIHDSVDAGSTKINLQAAVRYHPVDNQTYIYIGSPLLPGEY
ncbi:MAG: YwmB family TATA-box binding protein [Bacillota bacterium]